MFLGVVPADCIRQIMKIVDFSQIEDVHVCCSGTFRLERAISQLHPQVRIHSNDVSLFSCSIGGLATGKPERFTFTDELAFIEEEFAGADDVTRAACVMVAFEMARYARRNNAFNVKHFDYYRTRFAAYVEPTAEKVRALLDAFQITSFYRGDWRDHARASVEMGSPILAFPPFTKGGYEIQFKFLNDNIAWDEPAYGLWDPKDLRETTRALEAEGVRYVMLTDQLWEDQEPVIKFTQGRRLPHYCYARVEKSSLIHKHNRAQPFRYRPLEVDRLGPTSEVSVVAADAAHMNFVKDVYLSKAIIHSSGMQNFLIFIDGMLAGSIIYDDAPITRAAYGPTTINLLSDLSITRDGRVSKLIAMLATSRSLVGHMERKFLKRYENLVTTAFSKHPNSMKYRGVLKKLSRRENDTGDGFVIQYGGPVRDDTPQDIYAEWWGKNGRGKTADGDQAAAA
jgi:hypothetical protein